MHSRKFPSFKEAIAYLEEHGTLQFFGKAGHMYEYSLYTFTHRDGRAFRLNVYDDGKIEVKE